MNERELVEDLGVRLRRQGGEEVEVCVKSGRSRRFEVGAQGRIALESREQGWAVRAGGRRSSFFAAGSGRLQPDGPWPAPDGGPLLLPTAAPVAGWSRPSDFDAPAVSETEAVGLLESVERRLARELPGARLLRGVIEEGSSETRLANSRGVEGVVENRTAAILLEAAHPREGPSRAIVYRAERAARSFSPSPLTRRLVDRLLVLERGGTVERDRGDMLLAPAVGCALLDLLRPLLVGPGGEEPARALRDRAGRIGNRSLTIVDDGRLTGGVLEAPVDGEGVETRRAALIEEGVFRQPLLTWRQARPGQKWSGCTVRRSFRDVPAAGPTHLFVQPDPSVSPAALLGSVSRGFYLLEEVGPGHCELAADRFELPVCGFVLRRGGSRASFARARLCGGIGALLQGVQAVARDLSFRPLGGMIGAPTLLVTGLELRPDRRQGP